MSQITAYTTYQDVRSALGVSEDELEDSTLALVSYANALDLAILDIGPALPTLYTDVSAVLVSDRTVKQQRFILLTQLFATFYVAQQVGVALPMLAPKSLSDGKATMSRFADAPYRLTMERIDEQVMLLRPQLSSAYAELNQSAQASAGLPTFISGAGAAVDRVTGA